MEDSAKIHIPNDFDVAPTFKKGDKQFLKFIKENVAYPEHEGLENLTGLVVVRMTIDLDGSTSNFEVAKSLGERYDLEAIRVATLTHKMWVPAKLNGEDIAFSYLLPIRFYAPKAGKRKAL
ncbi:energy transducer TonB [uncultured Pontibacter sp.]|uniref:energy transducer TonB n=1 Tax=uncultured Pontibacter sp. TaxID=453356 RepID=UPI0026077617|nr:energy transducer TonB [uncultured Pontibacter sp.]